MEQLSQIDINYLIKEYKFLNNSRIDNFYFSNNKYIIKIYVKTKGNYYLTISPGKYIYLTNEKNFTSEKNNFIDYLRKYLRDSKLTNIEQIENERILIINIEKHIEKINDGEKKEIKDKETKNYKLIIELFKPGNIILTTENLKILNSIVKKEFKDRAIKTNLEYELPPNKEITLKNLIKLATTNLRKEEKEQKKQENNIQNEKIGKILAKHFNLGGKYSNEILAITNIPKEKKLVELNEEEINKLEKKLIYIKNKEIEPFLVYNIEYNNKNDNITDNIINKNNENEPTVFIPFKFKSLNSYILKKTNSFNEAVKIYYSKIDREKNKQEEELQKEINKLKKRLQILKNQKEENIKLYENYTNIGNKIYENYSLTEKLIKLGQLLEENKEITDKGLIELKKQIKTINKKEKYILIKIKN